MEKINIPSGYIIRNALLSGCFVPSGEWVPLIPVIKPKK